MLLLLQSPVHSPPRGGSWERIDIPDFIDTPEVDDGDDELLLAWFMYMRGYYVKSGA